MQIRNELYHSLQSLNESLNNLLTDACHSGIYTFVRKLCNRKIFCSFLMYTCKKGIKNR